MFTWKNMIYSWLLQSYIPTEFFKKGIEKFLKLCFVQLRERAHRGSRNSKDRFKITYRQKIKNYA